MKKVLAALLGIAAFWGGLSYYQSHFMPTKPRAGVAAQSPAAPPPAAEATPGAPPDVTVHGPLANWMDRFNPWHKTPAPVFPPAPHPSDHVSSSPVGTSSAVVHKTFAITSAAKFAFEVPPHAASPQLNGNYRSFTQQAGSQSSDDSADVDLLLMNAEQYADFAGGHPADVVYSVDSSHEQDVAFVLPATFDKPVQYYLVFRNSTGPAGKKVVQADFRVDF
ncbi:MAG: hypothetical protein WB762_11005 [Candidatus Sulfotelmatobacter sp.]